MLATLPEEGIVARALPSQNSHFPAEVTQYAFRNREGITRILVRLRAGAVRTGEAYPLWQPGASEARGGQKRKYDLAMRVTDLGRKKESCWR